MVDSRKIIELDQKTKDDFNFTDFMKHFVLFFLSKPSQTSKLLLYDYQI